MTEWPVCVPCSRYEGGRITAMRSRGGWAATRNMAIRAFTPNG